MIGHIVGGERYGGKIPVPVTQVDDLPRAEGVRHRPGAAGGAEKQLVNHSAKTFFLGGIPAPIIRKNRPFVQGPGRNRIFCEQTLHEM